MDQEQPESLEEQRARHYEEDIAVAIVTYLSANGGRAAPDMVGEAIFSEMRGGMVLIYGDVVDDIARKNFHRHWVGAISRLARSRMLEIHGMVDLALPGWYRRNKAA